ncbi:MAG: hypothetical protein EBZ29_12705 [Synechococcaceae bacterium WB9_4xC_028]|nr:hypothetical protein [Synechococcaceae bacterium WB9_4xC_028]
MAAEAGGLVKAARELFRLQVVRVLMALGVFRIRWPRFWFWRPALAASSASLGVLSDCKIVVFGTFQRQVLVVPNSAG